jgi:uncharacterized membrane protein YbhN (UPF0104 family)
MDVCCLICSLYALHVPAPWTAILGIWSAGAAADSLSPTPAGVGVVDIVLIAALAAAGIPVPTAVAATVLYRLLSFKILSSMIWFGYQRWQHRGRAGPAPPGACAPSSSQHSAPARAWLCSTRWLRSP